MARKHKPQEIVGKLREAEIVLAQGGTAATKIALVAIIFILAENGTDYCGHSSSPESALFSFISMARWVAPAPAGGCFGVMMLVCVLVDYVVAGAGFEPATFRL